MANVQEIKVPDIGGAQNVDVIEVMVKPGDTVSVDTPLMTLETDKATMEIPSPYSGTVKELVVKVGDKVSQGTSIMMLETSEQQSSAQEEPKSIEAGPSVAPAPAEVKQPTEAAPPPPAAAPEIVTTASQEGIFAGPAVRRLAREFGVDLAHIRGTGRKARILKEDLQDYVKNHLKETPSQGAFNLPANPVIDFSQFGEIESKPLNKIKRLTGQNLHRAWLNIPHVTQFDEADITELEAFRKAQVEKNKNSEFKLTILAFVCGAVSKALKAYPQFNASLDAGGENLIYKKYCNIGIAVETPNGLVVPVIKNADRLTISEIAQEMARLSSKARDKGLMPADMSGGSFTISSLGGIGGTAFTPIVNSPEVAILGLSRSTVKPIYLGDEFKPRLMLPLSLSYDHRVIDGAEAARFSRYLSDALADIRTLLL